MALTGVDHALLATGSPAAPPTRQPAATRTARPAPPAIDDPEWDGRVVDALREREYGRLDAQGQVYLDYTGAGLYAASQLREHQELLRTGVLGNPHSTSPAAARSTELADAARRAILSFLHASPDEYAVVFTPNATGALRLVGEAYPFAEDGRLLLTADNHNSVNGIREHARSRGGPVTYVPLRTPELRIDEAALRAELDRPGARGRSLFAFPAQSNYSGVRHPLAWIDLAHERGWDVLLDAAALVPAGALDLDRHPADFVTVSWYKVFGHPTGVGSLVARREALARLRRPWFAGGSIGVVSVALPRNTWAEAETGFEDGTIDYLALPGIEIGLRHMDRVGRAAIARRTGALTRWLLARLGALRHADGAPLLRLYGPTTDAERGGTLPFNVLDRSGGVVGFWEVEAAAAARGISLRTGCFCNPGASEAARGITAADMERVFALGHQPSIDELAAIMPGKALGAVRASVGIATNERDVRRFVAFLQDVAADRAPLRGA